MSPYEDSPQGIGHAATISAPHMHAHASESLLPYLHPAAKILDIGSGSGYLTHVLANLVGTEGRVVGIDHIQSLVDLANTNMAKSEDGKELLGSGQVRFVKGDGRKGWKEGGPYDAIHVGAAAKEAHSDLIDQLKAPGRYGHADLISSISLASGLTMLRMFIPVGDSWGQHIWVIDKAEDGSVTKVKDFAVMYVPLTDEPTK